jgi:hypothetical protein
LALGGQLRLNLCQLHGPRVRLTLPSSAHQSGG